MHRIEVCHQSPIMTLQARQAGKLVSRRQRNFCAGKLTCAQSLWVGTAWKTPYPWSTALCTIFQDTPHPCSYLLPSP